MNDLSSKIAESLLQIKAIKLNPANHFTWASGWYSPIYCDNRKILSYPAVRKQVYEGFERIIAEKYPDADIIAGRRHRSHRARRAGRRTDGQAVHLCPQLAENARADEPGRGRILARRQGRRRRGPRLDGGSSLSAVEALREAGCDVLGMVAIFTYGFPTAAENFAGADVKLDTLSDYKTMIELAAKQGYVHEDELQTLQQWRRDPANWKKSAQ